jgi:beta-phosphoglucomutase-like phosphatase (HAD superfamily)
MVMATPTWSVEMDTGLGALISELEAAESGETGLGKKPDWNAIKAKAAAIKSHAASALHDYAQQNGKLQGAAKFISQLQEQLAELKQCMAQQQLQTGTGAPKTGVGQSSGQTVYISAGATAGIAAGALLIGAVGGYATKSLMQASKDKKIKPAAEAKEVEEEEAPKSLRGK